MESLQMINVFADKHLYNLETFLPDNVNLTLYDSANGPTEIPEDTQAMLIRTVTKINSKTFPQFPESLSFIGTGSVGTDHVDLQYLQKRNIGFTSAAGCNARSVGEYVTVALLLWAEHHNTDLSTYRVGIVGVGHTGSEVKELLERLNIDVTLYDPPRAKRDSNFISATLEQVLKSDILTLHTPLNKTTAHPTYHWLDEEKLNASEFELIINASRGGVIDEAALLKAFKKRTVKNYILDVWENEPVFNDEIARNAFLKTPHIAGYSVQAKERASKMIIRAMSKHFSADFNRSTQKKNETSNQAPPNTFWSLTDALTYYHPIQDYETRLRMLVGRSDKEKRKGFSRIRTEHPLRGEFGVLKIPAKIIEKFPALKTMASN